MPAVLLAAVLTCAVARPFGLPEAAVAVPAAGAVVATGALSPAHAWDEAGELAPVLGFLAAVLVLARLCDEEGLFRAAGAWMAGASRGHPPRLLAAVFVFASAVTAVLSLDATVVLLTPIVLVTARQLGARAAPHAYACAHLSNTASLLLPVSNLTNLLAFTASGLTFVRFAGLMALPWLVAIAVEYVVLRRWFAVDLAAVAAPPQTTAVPPTPWFALVTVVATLGGFVVASAVGVSPAWAAAAGALVMGARAIVRPGRRTTVRMIAASADVPFLAFVLGLGIVVRAVVENGLADVLAHAVPSGTGLWALLAVAALAALLANVINNLPAVLVLVPLTAPAGPGMVLAVLLGANIGPNLTYAGSLATLLWRRILHRHQHPVGLREFTMLGLATVPASLVGAVVALWAALRVVGT
ncbi:SLC13 family permease [Yinghuangia sp. YIM S10712]|uniref:SLC13 family permease n=1 Tax=Yinghuangia sp. YIM S10712 TaxID=3436930 RepID=UPI003F5350B2